MSQSREESNRESTYRIPSWVKVFGIIAIMVILLVVAVLVTDTSGEHGPGRHIPSGGTGDTLPANVTEEYTPPVEHGEQQP